MLIPIPSADLRSEVPVHFPADCCCNCGGHAGLAVVPTRLVKTTYLGIGGVEKSVTAPLPYCTTCAVTARRLPKGLGAKLVMSALGTVILLILYVVGLATGRVPVLSDSNETAFWMLAALSAVLVFGGYALRRPRGAQTSWYQPVRLVKLRQRFTSGAITGYVFAFTNPTYRQLFASANAAAVARKEIAARAA